MLFSAGIFLFAVNDALGKWLVADFPVGQLIALRSIGAAFFLIPLLWRARLGLLTSGHPWLHVIRILCMTADSFAFYFATKLLPLADVMTFYLAAPLLIMGLSALVLGETVSAMRWMAGGVGFCGVVLALDPSGSALSASALVALAGSLMFALGIIATRKLRHTEWQMLVAQQFFGAGLIGAVTCPFAWTQPSLIDLLLMLAIGSISMLCFIGINKALTLAEASVLAPLHYTSIAWAALFGWMVWGDVPSPRLQYGIALIVGSGLFVWFWERRRAPAAA